MGIYTGNFTVTKLNRSRKYYTSWYNDDLASQGTYNGNTPKEYVGRIYFDIGTFDSSKYKITGVTMTVTRESGAGAHGSPITLHLYAGAISASDLINDRKNTTSSYAAQKIAGKTLKKVSEGATTFSLTADDLTKFNKYCIENESYSLMVFSREGDLDSSSKEYTANYTGLTKVIISYTYTEKAAIGTPTNAILGSSNTITFDALGSGFKYKALWTLGEKSYISTDFDTTTSGSGSLSYTIPSNWGAQFPSDQSKTGSVALITYNTSGTEIGRHSYDIIYSCPSNYTPSISLSYSDTSGATKYYTSSSMAASTQVVLQNLSKKNISFSCSNLYGTSCNYSINVVSSDGASLGSWSGTGSSKTISSVTFSKSGTITITAKVTDGRAKTNSKSTTLTVTALPTFTKTPSVVRAKADGTEYTAGTYLKLIGTLSNTQDGIQLTVSPAFEDGATSNTIKTRGTASATSYLSTKTISTDKKYDITVTILSNKYYNSSGSLISYNVSLPSGVSSANYLLHFKNTGKAIGIGSAAGDDNTVAFGWKAVFNAGLSLTSPLAVESGGTGAKQQSGAWTNIVAPGGTFTGNVIVGSTSVNKSLTTNGSLYLCKSANPEIVFKVGSTQRGNFRISNNTSDIRFQFWQNGLVNEVFQLPATSLTTGSGTNYYDILTTKDYPYSHNFTSGGTNVFNFGSLLIQTGHIDFGSIAGGTDYSDSTITFTKAYSGTPAIIVGFDWGSTDYHAGRWSICCCAESSTGFTARVYNGEQSSAREPDAYWIAIGK